jgi:hypothetical protein
VYQRHAFDWKDKHDRWYGHGRKFDARFIQPQVSSGWFQRPYPYHLDYYKMRYGGSYAPYFGNLYGPPQVVTAPPYYGPYYDGFGSPGDRAPLGQYFSSPDGRMYGAPVIRSAPDEELDKSPSEGDLPAPVP